MKTWLIRTDHKLDMTQAFSGPRRVFFVGEHWWAQVNRPTSKRFHGQEVKQHGLWYFVRMYNAERHFVAEVPVVSWWMTRRWARLERQTAQLGKGVPVQLVDYNHTSRVSQDLRLNHDKDR